MELYKVMSSVMVVAVSTADAVDVASGLEAKSHLKTMLDEASLKSVMKIGKRALEYNVGIEHNELKSILYPVVSVMNEELSSGEVSEVVDIIIAYLMDEMAENNCAEQEFAGRLDDIMREDEI